MFQEHRDVMMLLKVEENYRAGKSLDVSAGAQNGFRWVNSSDILISDLTQTASHLSPVSAWPAHPVLLLHTCWVYPLNPKLLDFIPVLSEASPHMP